MRATLCHTVVILALLGQADPGDAPSSEPELIRVLAIHATSEGRASMKFDPTLAPLREYLTELPYDTFREVKFGEVEAPYGVDTAMPISERYAVHCIPLELNDAGEVVFDAFIQLTGDQGTVEALRVSGRAARGHGVVFRGLEMPSGELLVVLSIAKAQASGGGGGGQGQRANEDPGSGDAREGDGEGGGDGQDGAQAGDTDPSTSVAEDPESEREGDADSGMARRYGVDEGLPLPPDLANVEGILNSLEEQDKREQESARNRRYEVIIRGDWW